MIFNMVLSGALLFIAATGLFMLLYGKEKEYQFRRYEFLLSRARIGKKKSYTKTEHVNVLKDTAFFISRETYVTVWCFIVAIFLLSGIVGGVKFFITIAVLALVLGIPLEKVGGYTMPFGIVLRSLKKQYVRLKEAEIYDAMTMLRNMAIMKKDRPVTADHMIEGIMAGARYMQPYYPKMIHLMRLNKKEEALESFVEEVNVPLAASFGRLLVKLDEINPARLEETIQMHQKSIKEERITAHKQRDELISDLIYIPVVCNVLLVFMNFMYVVYFFQQKELLQTFIK